MLCFYVNRMSLDLFMKTFIPRSVSEYAAELELRSDLPLPTKFRCRGRVGRGGRIVIDRVPVCIACTFW
jgi:hypothetical protein